MFICGWLVPFRPRAAHSIANVLMLAVLQLIAEVINLADTFLDVVLSGFLCVWFVIFFVCLSVFIVLCFVLCILLLVLLLVLTILFLEYSVHHCSFERICGIFALSSIHIGNNQATTKRLDSGSS